MKEIADKIYRNAKIYSVGLDGAETHADSITIKNEKFIYVGENAGVKILLETTQKLLIAAEKA